MTSTISKAAACRKTRRAMRVRQLIEHRGVLRLQLTDKPALEQAFVNWARNYQPSAVAHVDRVVP